MKITIESTTKIVELDGVPVRVWQGEAVVGDHGTVVPVVAFVTRLMPEIPSGDPRHDAFDRDLKSCAAPRPVVDNLPSRMTL